MFRLFPGYFWEFLVGACRLIRQILTLFQTKKNDIFHPRFKTWPLRNYVIIIIIT